MTGQERLLALTVGLIQCAVALEFMMVMPLGPWLADALALPPSAMGWVSGSYMAAAFVSGLVLAGRLDRIGRRVALGLALAGLALATCAGGLAETTSVLIVSRIAAGLFGGPAAALSLAALSDGIAPERRGRALALALGGLSVATVLGIPAVLEIAHGGGWRAAFFATTGLTVVAAGLSLVIVPPARATSPPRALRRLIGQSEMWLAIGALSAPLIQMFIILPILAVWLERNLGFPRDDLAALYLVAGLTGLATMQLGGQLTDRFGGVRVSVVAAIGMALATLLLIARNGEPALPLFVLIPALTMANASRMVGSTAVFLRIAEPGERAAVMSVLSAAQHAASAAGGFIGAHIVATDPTDGRLLHVADSLLMAAAVGMVLVPLILILGRRCPASG